MSTSLFWGIIMILIGLSIIIKIVFHIDFSIFRVLLAFLLIYLGIKLFMGKDFSFFTNKSTEQSVVFGERTITKIEDGKEYNVVFGGGKIDLRTMTFPDSAKVHVKINTVFGGTQIFMNKDVAVEINAHTVFGGTKLPDNQVSAFGDAYYKSDTTHQHKALVIIEANTVFGGTQIRNEY